MCDVDKGLGSLRGREKEIAEFGNFFFFREKDIANDEHQTFRERHRFMEVR